MDSLDQFINDNKNDMLADLTNIVKDLKHTLRLSPDDYLESNYDDPSIDIRLCIDITERFGISTPTWGFRTGISDFDPYHSEYCAASCVTLDTDPSKLLNKLINQLGE
jgi:hypothetical protein